LRPKPVLLIAAAVAALVLSAILGTTDSAHAGTFNPTIKISVANPTAGAHSDFTTDFGVPSGDVNFGAAVFFFPSDWDLTAAKDVPLGAIVAQLTAQATLGLVNGQCDNILTVQFKMLNSSVDIKDTVEFADADDNGTGDVFEDKDDSGLQDGIEKYPAFINRITNDAQPIRRAAGVEIVAGVNVLLQFLVFDPGTSIIREIPSDESLGYPTVTFLQAIGDPEATPEPNAITDFCSPLTSQNITFGVTKDNPCTDKPGATLDPVCAVKSAPLELLDNQPKSDPDEGGIPLFTNPGEGDYTFTAIALGQRDADNDGYENTLDTCPFDANQGDPRIKGEGDFDEDGLDVVCDPDDKTGAFDFDNDGYPNRGDNCPQEPNGEEQTNQKESDKNAQGDPRPDGIGDVCDPNPDTPDGDVAVANITSHISIGPSEPGATESPGAASPTPANGKEDDGGGSGALIIIIIAVVAGVVVVGGGAFYFMRRGGGGTAT